MLLGASEGLVLPTCTPRTRPCSWASSRTALCCGPPGPLLRRAPPDPQPPTRPCSIPSNLPRPDQTPAPLPKPAPPAAPPGQLTPTPSFPLLRTHVLSRTGSNSAVVQLAEPSRVLSLAASQHVWLVPGSSHRSRPGWGDAIAPAGPSQPVLGAPTLPPGTPEPSPRLKARPLRRLLALLTRGAPRRAPVPQARQATQGPGPGRSPCPSIRLAPTFRKPSPRCRCPARFP